MYIVYMYIYIYIFIYIFVYVYIHVCVYVCMHLFIHCSRCGHHALCKKQLIIWMKTIYFIRLCISYYLRCLFSVLHANQSVLHPSRNKVSHHTQNLFVIRDQGTNKEEARESSIMPVGFLSNSALISLWQYVLLYFKSLLLFPSVASGFCHFPSPSYVSGCLSLWIAVHSIAYPISALGFWLK